MDAFPCAGEWGAEETNEALKRRYHVKSTSKTDVIYDTFTQAGVSACGFVA